MAFSTSYETKGAMRNPNEYSGVVAEQQSGAMQPQQVGDLLSDLGKALCLLDEINHELSGRISPVLVQSADSVPGAIPGHPKPPMCSLAQVLDDYLKRVNSMSRYMRYVSDSVQL